MAKTSNEIRVPSIQPAEDVLKRVDISRIKLHNGPHDRNYMANYVFYEKVKTDSGKPALVQRIFEVAFGFYNDTCTGFRFLNETRVIFFKSKMVACIFHGNGEVENCSPSKIRKTYGSYVLLQEPEEVCQIIQESIFAKSGFVEAYETKVSRFEDVGNKNYLWVYHKEPRIEQLIKAGFTAVAKDIFRGEKLDCPQGVTKVHKMLGVSKKSLGKLRKINPNMDELQRYRRLREQGVEHEKAEEMIYEKK